MRLGLVGRGLAAGAAVGSPVVGVRDSGNVGSADEQSALALEPVQGTHGPLSVSASAEMKDSNLIVPHSMEHSKLKDTPDEARSCDSCACGRVPAPAHA